MTPEEQYPSTSDCAKLLKDSDDAVLICLVNSRKRIERGHTRNNYHSSIDGSVCAIGAVLVEDGFDNGKGYIPHMSGMDLWMEVEHAMSEEAKEAIDLLNAAALELHPESEEYGSWSGPLEWINQEYRSYDVSCGRLTHAGHVRVVKREVLRCYDRAIEKRLEMVTA